MVRRESSPSMPSRPSSSPAKTIGTPGSVNCRPTATWCRAAEPVVVRIRGVSCEPRMFQLVADRAPAEAGGERPHRGDRVGTVAPRHADRQPEARARVRRGAQPLPDREREAVVVHRAVPAVAVEVAAGVVPVLGEDERVG